MSAPDQVKQGTSYYFSQCLEGEDVNEFTYSLEVKQYPDDTPSVMKTLTTIVDNQVTGVLTAAETASLAVGLWYINITSSDPDEDIQEERRIQITKAWA